jgi:alpha-tubulin suppressor-like RCC1 family protein
MDDQPIKDNNLISCSESHAVAIGMYGHLYVWGSSMNSEKLIEEISFCKDDNSDQSSSYDAFENEHFTGKIGFQDQSQKFINKPVFYSLKHPIYDIKAIQVACARNFTAVVAVEKTHNDDCLASDYQKLIFETETTEGISEFRSPNSQLSEEDYAKVLLSNKIRHDIDEYLKMNSIKFIQLFKSNQIKVDSFINIMTQIVKSQLSYEDFHRFLDYKKMKLAGKTITLKPLYELLNKCPQGRGVLYILGNGDAIPKQGDVELSYTVKHDTLMYNLIFLPERVYVLKAACGDNFVLFLTQTGKVYSWGTHPTPSLGKNRSLTVRQIKVIPELDPELTSGNWYTKDICCGVNHCLALSSTGIVYTWGEGLMGKLGNGRLDGLSRPEPINIDSNDVVMIRAGHHSSFCKTRDKGYFAWGDISNNKFGSVSLKTSEKPYRFTYDFEVADIAIGIKSCVLIAQNCSLYQTNISEDQITCLNRKYKHLEGIQFYQATAFGNNFFAVSTKGSIYSWNLDESEKLLGRHNEPVVPYEIPSCIQHFLPKEMDEMTVRNNATREYSRQVAKVACTEENTFLITDKGEAIVCGDNQLGQMCVVYGDLEADDEQHPEQFPIFQLIPRLSMNFGINIREIECGAAHVLAINENFKVMAWGANSYGQLGHGFFSNCEKSPDIISALKNESIKMISAGLNHSMVLTNEGQIFSFGCSEFGKLGLGKISTSVLYSTPKQIPRLKNIRKISCGENHSAAINRENEILIWGNGWNGQLGCGSQETVFEPTSILTKVEWKDVACGANHTLGLSINGTAYQWGEVCMLDEESVLHAPTKVKGLEEIHFKRIYASNGYSLVLTEIGTTFYSWGKQMYKRIADGKDTPNGVNTRPLSVSVPYNERIADINIGTQHGALVTDQGKVYTWGYSYGGRLGEDKAKGQESKPYNGVPVDLSYILAKAEPELKNEFNADIQSLLQNESDYSKENYLREVDQQIFKKFSDCIEFFIKISNLDSDQELFFSKVQHKQLNRLQQKPFEVNLVLNEPCNEEITKRIYGWSALVTTFQVHCCYLYRLMGLKLKEEKKLEILSLVYCDMEKDLRLSYTAIYLARMLLNKLLSQPEVAFPEFMESPDSIVYRNLIQMIISSSDEDMSKFRKLASDTLHDLGQTVNTDEFGIDLDPTHTVKNTCTIKISAYQINKNIIDRRMGKLKQIVTHFVKALDEVWTKEQFSDIIYFVTKDFLSACSEKFDFNYKTLENLNVNDVNIVNTVLKIVFEPLWKALENPDKYYIMYGFSFENKENNLKSLSETISKFFDGTDLGSPPERWLNDVDRFLKLERHMKIKAKIVNRILFTKSDLEEKYIESIFFTFFRAIR